MAINKSPMERMKETSDNLEVWWDSSPLVFESWKRKRIKDKPLESVMKKRSYLIGIISQIGLWNNYLEGLQQIHRCPIL